MHLDDLTEVQPNADGSITVAWFRDELPPLDADLEPFRTLVGSITVWFRREGADELGSALTGAAGIQLTLAEGLTPTVLQRFPWARMLAMADAGARATLAPDLETFVQTRPAGRGRRPPEFRRITRMQRPGRRGHPDDFYEQIAARYQALRRAGVTKPTKTIGAENMVSRNTAAGWINTARKKGYLPPGRPGRPG